MAKLSFTLDSQTLNRLEKECYDRHLSKSKLLQIALNYFFDEEQQDKDDAALAEAILTKEKEAGIKPLTTEEVFSKFETKND